MWVRNIPFGSHMSYCDFPLGRYLETLCSMPIIFIEGEMWSRPSLFLFYVLLCADGEPAMWGNQVRGRHCTARLIRAETKPKLFSERSARFPVPLALMPPMVCVRSEWQVPFPRLWASSNWLHPCSSWLLLVWGLLLEIMLLAFSI